MTQITYGDFEGRNNKAWTYLKIIDANTWSRYQFGHASKTGLMVNNISKSFNRKVPLARDKLVVSLMEMIRR